MKEIPIKWSVHENLLQWYRSIFIASQSFLLVVGTLFLEKCGWMFYGIFAISLCIVWIIWFPVVKSRHKIVDYYKGALELDEENINQLCTEKEYVHSKAKRKEANNRFQIKTNWRTTRKKIDLWLPISFTIIWLLLAYYKIK